MKYSIPGQLLGSLSCAALTRKPRSFARDAQRTIATLSPAIQVLGAEHVPAREPCLLACNHYTRPGLGAWWLVLAISTAVAACRASHADPEIHWVMTAAWTFPGSPWRRRLLTPLTQWAFDRVAQVYGFVPMPPMPPDPCQVEARAIAVLRTVRLARQIAPHGGMIGLAPEGRDVPGGLGQPPPGAGTFIALLVQAGLPVLPIGVFEQGRRLCVSFGAPFTPTIPLGRAARDREVTRQVMDSIARQLPPNSPG